MFRSNCLLVHFAFVLYLHVFKHKSYFTYISKMYSYIYDYSSWCECLKNLWKYPCLHAQLNINIMT